MVGIAFRPWSVALAVVAIPVVLLSSEPGSIHEAAFALSGTEPQQVVLRHAPAFSISRKASTTLFGSPEPRLERFVGRYHLVDLERGRESTAIQHADRPAATCTVSSKLDSGPETLRDCLEKAVAGDTIQFDPLVFPPTGPQTIPVASDLPWIEIDGLTVDASNAGVVLDGATAGTNALGIVIDGARGVSVRGLQVRNFCAGIVLGNGASGCVIGGDRGIGSGPTGQGNVISGNTGPSICGAGIQLQNAETSGNRIVGNLIGTDVSGGAANPNKWGVVVYDGPVDNVIGGAHTPRICDGPCNLVSGNSEIGIGVQGEATTRNKILGNFVGTDLSGGTAVPNRNGVVIDGGATETQVGGSGQGEGNVISGNDHKGVYVLWEGSTRNAVVGNIVGLGASGSKPLPNYDGVELYNTTQNQIGSDEPRGGNIISGNRHIGLWLQHHSEPGNVVVGNKIGTDISGTRALPNRGAGLMLTMATGNEIGGTRSRSGNLISGNSRMGVQLEMTSTLNTLHGNLIGTDATGLYAIPNARDGLIMGYNSSHNVVGGTAPGEGNVVSGNGESGIKIQAHEQGWGENVGNRVLGNRIGTNAEGTAAVSNGGDGITVLQARDTVIGGEHTPWMCDRACNLISGNGQGVNIQGRSPILSSNAPPGAESAVGQAMSILVAGNFIGTDALGKTAIPNQIGITLQAQATGCVVGGSENGGGNLVSGNRYDDISVSDAGTTDIRLLGNRIGTTADGTAGLGNGRTGVLLDGVSGIAVGGHLDGEGNVISGHHNNQEGAGVCIQGRPGATASNNEVVGNLIGTNAHGSAAIPNDSGVLIVGGSNTAVVSNTISGNIFLGVGLQRRLDDSGPTSVVHNNVKDNFIGVAVDGRAPLANGLHGVQLYDAHDNTIGPGNTIAFNQNTGVMSFDDKSVGNRITRNSIYRNARRQIDPPVGAIGIPTLTAMSEGVVHGQGCPMCTIEVFANTVPEPFGQLYLTTVAADTTGAFAVPVDLATLDTSYCCLSATQINAKGTTSDFAPALQLRQAVPTATPTPTTAVRPTPLPTRDTWPSLVVGYLPVALKEWDLAARPPTRTPGPVTWPTNTPRPSGTRTATPFLWPTNTPGAWLSSPYSRN